MDDKEHKNDANKNNRILDTLFDEVSAYVITKTTKMLKTIKS